MTQILRLRKHLADAPPEPIWPTGARLLPLAETDPRALHTILVHAYVDGFGSTPPFDAWWPNLIADTEYDSDLVFIAADSSGQPIGLALCWTSGFIKDLAVVPQWRGKGIGDALLAEVFSTFHQRGLPHVDLKVVAANAPAIRLYQRAGMVEALL